MKRLFAVILIFGLAIFAISGPAAPADAFSGALTEPEITGVVVYGNAVPAETRFVSHVKMKAEAFSGRNARMEADSDAHGMYRLRGFGTDSYIVSPSKNGEAKKYINSFDAAKVVEHVMGRTHLAGNQLIVADVSGNGLIQSYDAALIGAYVVSRHPFGQTGTWKFLPESRVYPTITNSIFDQNYTALLMGDVSGNWKCSGESFENRGPELAAAITAPEISTPAGNEVIVPLRIEGAKDKEIISYEFELRYDPSVITPQTKPIGIEGTVSRGLTFACNPDEAGLLRVAVYGAMPISKDGTLLNIKFKAVGAPGSVSPLIWERVMLNEGDPQATVSDGQVELSSPEDRS